jgi:hypothetical protein
MSTLNADLRAGVVGLLKGYATSAGIKLQVYPGRPKSLNPPTAFVDAMSARIHHDGLQRQTPVASVLVIWGLFDSGSAVAQRDAFVDGFIEWFRTNADAAGANTVAGITAVEDLPAYVPDWVEDRTAYYASQITVEGYGE